MVRVQKCHTVVSGAYAERRLQMLCLGTREGALGEYGNGELFGPLFKLRAEARFNRDSIEGASFRGEVLGLAGILNALSLLFYLRNRREDRERNRSTTGKTCWVDSNHQ